MAKKYIDAEHFGERVCEAMGMTMDNLPMGYPDPVQAILAMLETEPSVYVPRWIPVEDGLPEEDGRYLVTRYDDVTNTEFIDILWYEENLWWNRHSTGDYAVTAWMPLPSPYKEGEQNG